MPDIASPERLHHARQARRRTALDHMQRLPFNKIASKPRHHASPAMSLIKSSTYAATGGIARAKNRNRM
jgi:hypothetical protein